MIMSAELQAMLIAPASQDAIDGCVEAIKQGELNISMEALYKQGKYVKGDFDEEGVEIHEIGACWISVYPDGKIVSIGLNEKDENDEWITFY